jgi:hypothetical protein
LKGVELPSGKLLWTRPYRVSQRGAGNGSFAQEIQKLDEGTRHCIIDLGNGREVFELSPTRWNRALGANDYHLGFSHRGGNFLTWRSVRSERDGFGMRDTQWRVDRWHLRRPVEWWDGVAAGFWIVVGLGGV